ncbi:mite group 2 allergen-like Ixo r 2 [Atheta coriaria]|uniref:mite group 2 allergen-like Ixo r 2 n=1 Tax=Dalotia coriaria TaxID=877792 RepID=UPI0031F3EF65
MHKLLSVLLLCTIFGKVVLDTVVYNDCGSEYNLNDVDIEGCNKTSCILPKGKSANINIKLYGRSPDSHTLTQKVFLIFNTINVPLTVIPGDLCASQIECPVRGTANASFSALMDFSTLPNVQSAVTLHWRIFNENKEQIMCFKANAKYENPKTN